MFYKTSIFHRYFGNIGIIKAVPITLVSNPTSTILDRPAGVFRTHNEMNHREMLSQIDLHKNETPDR
jgi:hypothetical protein